ncbi:MAG TPA: MFS transporter [Streptosporangiaceae bacterium]
MNRDGAGPRGERDRRGRVATATAFFVQGLCFAVVVTRVSVLQDKFHLSNGQLTIVLLIVPVIAGVGSVAAGPLAARFGSAIVLRVAQPLVCLTLPAIGFASRLGELYAAVAVFGLVVGVVDATMNMQGAVTEKRYGYSIITAFYGFWSMAGILGGLWNAAAGKLGLSLGVAFSVAAAGGLAGSLISGRALFGKSEDVAPVSEAAAKKAGITIPWRPIILIGIAMGCMYVGDAAVSNFSSVYMDKVQHGGKAVLPLAYAAYQTMMVAGRAIGDHTVRRFGAAAVVRAGAVVAAVGLLCVVLAPSPYLAIGAFALTGLGFCVVPPQCFSATSKLDPTGSGIAISRVNVFNYAGFVLGAALAGGIAGGVGGSAGWRAAYAAPLVLTAVIVALARGFDPKPALGPVGDAGTAAEAEAGTAPA